MQKNNILLYVITCLLFFISSPASAQQSRNNIRQNLFESISFETFISYDGITIYYDPTIEDIQYKLRHINLALRIVFELHSEEQETCLDYSFDLFFIKNQTMHDRNIMEMDWSRFQSGGLLGLYQRLRYNDGEMFINSGSNNSEIWRLYRTVIHEVRHHYQDMCQMGLSYDEKEAEADAYEDRLCDIPTMPCHPESNNY
jgi:hypothetical protein